MSIFYHLLVVQIYFLSEIYLLVSAMILLADRYGFKLIILLNVRSFYMAGRRRRILFPAFGLFLTAGLLIFPVMPGPAVIGDIIPAVTVLLCVFNFFLFLADGQNQAFSGKKDRVLGWIALAVAALHFLFPGIVLI